MTRKRVCPFDATTDSECSMFRERSVAGISDDIPSCPVHGAYIEDLHAHVTRHGIATTTGRTVRDREQPEYVAVDTAAWYVRAIVALPDGAHVPTVLGYAADGKSCPMCTPDPRGSRVYGTAIATRDGVTVGAVHVNLCAIRHNCHPRDAPPAARSGERRERGIRPAERSQGDTMAPELQPLGGSSARDSFAYWGKREDWLVALSKHRDSDALERSNWRVIVPAMFAAHPEDAVVETFSNWAVGWSAVLLVRPGTAAADEAQHWADKLADYPVADEEDYSELEYDEEWCVRCDGATRETHPTYRCTHFRSADEASELRDRWHSRHD